MVHRYVASLFHGEPEDPSLILVRLCGNRMCINPNHMRYKKRPTQTHASKVTEEQILIIKDLLASTDHTMREIGESFGLSIASIKSINRGRTWKHVGYDEYGIPVRPWNDK